MAEADAMSEVDSLASTVLSDSDAEYELDEILYETDSEDGRYPKYLVKWTGYELHHAKFIPADNFGSEITLRDWERKKRAIAAGRVAPFDIDSWRADQDRRAEETKARKAARRTKRAERAARRLALSDHPGNDNTEDLGVNGDTHPYEEATPDSDDAQLTRGSARGKCLSAASDTSSLFVPEEPTPETRPKRRRLLRRKDLALLMPYDPEVPTSASDIQSGAPNDQLQLQQELHEQANQQPRPTRRSLNQHGPPQPQRQPLQPPRSNPQSPQSPVLSAPASTASLPKPPLSGFGVRPQTARPYRPKRREREPDVSQLKLLRPSEYSAREGGADSSLYSTIRSLEEVQPPSEPRNNIASAPTVISSESTMASTKPASSDRPPGPSPPQLKEPLQSSKEQDEAPGQLHLNLDESPATSTSAMPLPSANSRVRSPEVSYGASQGSSETLSAQTMSRPGGIQSLAAAAKPKSPVDNGQRPPQGPPPDRPHTTPSSGPLPKAGVSAQRPRSPSIPKEVVPSKDSISNQKEVQKASTDALTLSPRYSGTQQGAKKPQDASRPPLRRVPTSPSLSTRSAPRASRADREPSPGPSGRRGRPEPGPTRRRSPPRESRAIETRRNDRSLDDRESTIGQSGGDSYRPALHRASGSRRGHDFYRPSPSPPPPDRSRPQVPPHRNSYRPTAREDDPPRTEKAREDRAGADESHLVSQRSSPPSNRPPPKAAVDDEEAQIARMPVGIPIPGQSKWTTEGYWWNWGEVLAHVYFGPDKKRVGPVRLCGMTDEAKNDLLASKGPSRTFDMWFQDLYTFEEYRSLTEKTFNNSPRGNAWMEGFKDTNPDLFHMTEELREEDLIAIYRPAKAQGNVWLAWSRKSSCFDFLEWNTDRTPAGVPIYLAVRPPLPQKWELRSREREEPPRARRDFPENVHFRERESESRRPPEAGSDGRGRRLSIPAIDRARMAPQLPTPTQPLGGSPTAISPTTRDSGALAIRESSEEGHSTTTTADPRLRRRQSLPAMAPPDDYVHPSRRSLVEGHTHAGGSDSSKAKPQTPNNVKRPNEVAGSGNSDAMDLTPDFQAHTSPWQNIRTLMPRLGESDKMMAELFFEKLENMVRMTVKELACLQQGNEDATTDNFYLHFPLDQEEAGAEYKLMRAWLKHHDVMVWTDWAKFIKNCKSGVVIFHESFLAYWSMRPAIRDALWASSAFNFWNVRLARPLESPDERFCEPGSHFQRLFPSGHAYLITEDCFTDLRRTAMIICWFHSFQKHRPGFYKLFLRPDVMDYLDRRLQDPRRNKADDHLILSIRHWIIKANSISKRFPHFIPESLNPGQLDNINNNILCLPVPKYGSRTEVDNTEIPKGLTQVERDADHLIEAFAGFTILNAARFRKTIVITSIRNKPLFERWLSWGHVAVYSIGTFFDNFRLDEKNLEKKVSNGGRDGRPVQRDGVHSASQTPRTPIDPRTPKAPWETLSRESFNPAQAQQRASLRDEYPAPYE